jgi:hypothetical protein
VTMCFGSGAEAPPQRRLRQVPHERGLPLDLSLLERERV